MLASVWGNFAEWVGGLATAAAFWAAVGIFAYERRSEIRSQASLVYVSTSQGSHVEVGNRSDKAIFDVEAVVEPMSMLTAVITDEFEATPAFGNGTVYHYPSHEYYVIVKGMLKARTRKYTSMAALQRNVDIAPTEHGELFVPELVLGAMECYVVFRDARGRDWAINLRTKKLQKARRNYGPFPVSRNRLAARWWIAKNLSKWIWQNRLYHPHGRPEPLE